MSAGLRLASVACWLGRRWWTLGLTVAMLGATFAAFAPVLSNDFVSIDDHSNFLENEAFRGLGWSQVRTAFTAPRLGVYQPLPSLMLSAEYVIGGLDPWLYHATSLAIHLANVALLFGMVVRIIHRAFPEAEGRGPLAFRLGCAVPVLLFAVHPQRVEPVAFATAQLYLPAALFALAAIHAYLSAHPAGGATRRGWLAAMNLSAVVAMSCMPGAIGLPVVLLVLDVVLLKRFGMGCWAGAGARRAVCEKLPMLLASPTFAVVAAWAKSVDKMLVDPVQDSVAGRLAMATQGLWFYLSRAAAPFDIAPFYARPHDQVLWSLPYLPGAAIVLAVVAAAVASRRRRPWMLAGWACLLAMVAPHLGLMRVGGALAADRYFYMPAMVFPVLGALGLVRWVAMRPDSFRRGMAGTVVAAIAASGLLIGVSREATRHWHDSEAALRSSLARAPWSHDCLAGLGGVLILDHRPEEAIRVIESSLELGAEITRPQPAVWVTLGNAQAMLGLYEKAEASYRRALKTPGDRSQARLALGVTLTKMNRPDEAEECFRRLIKDRPDAAEPHQRLGVVLLGKGQLDGAIAEFRDATAIAPRMAEAHSDWGAALLMSGRLDEAVPRLRRAIAANPDLATARLNLGIALAQLGHLEESAGELRAASELARDDVQPRFALGAVLAQAGRLDEAVASLSEVLRLAPEHAPARSLLAATMNQRDQARVLR